MLGEVVRWLVESTTLLAGKVWGRTVEANGLEIILLNEPQQHQEAVRNLSAALELVRRHHPLSSRRIRRSLMRVVVLDAGLPEYRSFLRGATLPQMLVVQASPEELALVLVHEAAHAQLYSWGIRPSVENQDRIEAVCVGRELVLLRHLPNVPPQLKEFTRHKLELRWWESSQHRSRIAAELSKLRGLYRPAREERE